MSDTGWLTPESLPASTVVISILCPDDDLLIANVTGALDLLSEARNWVQYGAITPEEVADRMRLFVIGIVVS